MTGPIEILVNRFTQIGHERLEGLPVYNANLQVEAIDFQPCEHGLVGALVTPWFINILLLPGNVRTWRQHELGTKHTFELATGEQQFVLGDDEVVGRYFFRSVVSPPHCYKQQADARHAAQLALQKLLVVEAEPETQAVEFDPGTHKPAGRREFMRSIFKTGA